MNTLKEMRRMRLLYIKSIITDVKEQLAIPKAKIYPVRRDFSASFCDSDIFQTGYGLGFLSFFWQAREKRLIEIDCESDGRVSEAPLIIETFDDEIFREIIPVITKLLSQKNNLFNGTEFRHYKYYVTEFEQLKESCGKSLRNMLDC